MAVEKRQSRRQDRDAIAAAESTRSAPLPHVSNRTMVALLSSKRRGSAATRAVLAGQGVAVTQPRDAAEIAAHQVAEVATADRVDQIPPEQLPPVDARPALPGGEPLPATVRDQIEPLVQRDLGSVRVHSGPAAAATSADLGARAFTLGASIVLGRDASVHDHPLMAHEAAHVTQGLPSLARDVIDEPATGVLAGFDHLRSALTPDQYAMLSDRVIGRLTVPLVQLMDPESVEHLTRAEVLTAVMPQLATYEGPSGQAGDLVTTIAQSETLRAFLDDKLRDPVTIVVDDTDRPAVKFYLYDIELPTAEGLITVGALNHVSIATTDAIATHAYRAASQLIDVRMAQAKAEHAMTTVLPLIIQIEQNPADYALQEVQDLSRQCAELVGYVQALSDALEPGNADLAPQVALSLGRVTAVQKTAGAAASIAATFATAHEPGWSAGEAYADAEEGYADDAGLSPGGVLAGGNWFATKVFHGIGSALTAGHLDRVGANASAYRRGLISYHAYEENQIWNFGTSVLVAAVTALSAGLAGRAAAGLVGGFSTTTAGVVSGAMVGGTTAITGSMAGDVGAKIAATISGDRYVQASQDAMIVGPGGWAKAGMMGAVLGGVFGRIFGGRSGGPSEEYLEATRTARQAAGQTDVATTPPIAAAGETTGPVVYVNGEPVPPSHYGRVYHGDSTTPEQLQSSGGFKAYGTNWDLVEHVDATGSQASGGGSSALRGGTGSLGKAAHWGDWVYEVEGLPVWDVDKILQGKVRIAGMGEYRGALMHGEAESSIPGEIPLKNVIRFGRSVEIGKSGATGVRDWYTWETYPGTAPTPP